MKGIHGLILAIGLGIAGAILNFAYLANRLREVEKVAFLGIKEDKVVGRGEPLQEPSIEPVEIPRRAVGKLEDYAILWAARQTVVGRRVWRPLEGGSLVLRSDLKTPPQSLAFGVNLPPGVEERATGVPIDTRKFVPSLVQPGDLVSFIVSTPGTNSPLFAVRPQNDPFTKSEPKDAPASPAAPRDGVDLCGPFKVLSIGNRLGSHDVMQAAKIAQTQENVMIVLIRIENGKMQPEAARLMRTIEQAGAKPLGYLLHPRTQKQE